MVKTTMFEGDSNMWTLWNRRSKGNATKPTIPPKKEPVQLIKVSIYIAVTGGSPLELEVTLSPEHNPDTSAVYADFENWFKAETRKTGKYKYSSAPATFTFEGHLKASHSNMLCVEMQSRITI